MCTFRDCLRVQVEWNGACYLEDDIRRFLDNVVRLLHIFT